HERAALLRVRDVELQLLFIEARLTRISDHSHDCEPLVLRIKCANLESFSDCIFAGPVLLGKTAVNQHGGLSIGGIARVEKASAQQGNAHRAEIVGTDYAP